MNKYEVILFDLGGVLAELNEFTKMLEGQCKDEAELWKKWLSSPTVRAYESGKINSIEFGHSMVKEFNLYSDENKFIQMFTNLPTLYGGAEELIKNLSKNYITGILSNSNDIHWTKIFNESSIGTLCTKNFLSHKTGMLKPDTETFLYVIKELGISGDKIIFFDDNIINVNAANEAGIKSIRVKGLEELKSALRNEGILY